VLIAGPEAAAWEAAGVQAARVLGVPLRAHQVGPEGDLADPEGRFPAACGISDAGAVLLRPDGFVAWRAAGALADPVRALHDVLGRVLGRAAEPVLVGD
jgi:putative polyketide hydroxylase